MTENSTEAPNALQKLWASMNQGKWNCQVCDVLVNQCLNKCPACESPRNASPSKKTSAPASSSVGLFGMSSGASTLPPIFNVAETPFSKKTSSTSTAPTFNMSLFGQPKTAASDVSTAPTPVFNMSFFNKPKGETTEKPPLVPMCITKSPTPYKSMISATPPIPFSKLSNFRINSPLSQPDEVGSASGDLVLKSLDPHRDLPIGSTIVMTCGFGGFSQLGLGEEEDEDVKCSEEEGNTQEMASPCVPISQSLTQEMASPATASVDFTAKGPCRQRRASTGGEVDIGTTPSTKKWPAPNVNEAQIPLRMPNLDGLNIVSVEMGVMHGAAVTKDGRIFVWGGNDHSNLGYEGDDAWVPTEITNHFPEGTQIEKVTCGSSHTVFLTTEGEVYTAGTFKNDSWEGAFYDPTLKKVFKRLHKPMRLEYINTANTPKGNVEKQKIARMTDIGSGLDHMLMLDVDGNVWEMGVTIFGQRTSRRLQHTYLQPRRVPLKEKIRAIRCGSHYNLAISRDNDLYTWGQNLFLQCGHEKSELIGRPYKVDFKDPSVKLLDVGAGTHTTIALDTSGRLWSFGRNGSFELGRETAVPPKKMINGKLQHYVNEPEPSLPKLITAIEKNIIQIAVGANHWFAVARDSTTYAVGVNLEFRTGVGEEDGSSRFTKVFHDGNLRQDFEVLDASAGSNSSVFLLKRVTRRKRKPKRMLMTPTPSSRRRRKMQQVNKK